MDVIDLLRRHDIQPTPQRIAVAECVLASREHPTAEGVWESVRKSCPTISRATVYNTLNLFVDRGLIRNQVLKEGISVFDPHVDAHHHFIDTETGEIHDIPWNAIQVSGESALGEFEIEEYQVILRGRKRRTE
jgi:Fe2+ or Zn2+ uptake regulation protein